MRVRIQVVVEAESDTIPVVQEVATLERGPLQPEGLGLTLAEAKDLLRGVQETMVAAQVAAFEAQQECCPDCGRARRRNGRHEIVYRTPFGKLRLDSPRFYACPCQEATPRASLSPLAERLPERTAPELAYLEAKFGDRGRARDFFARIEAAGTGEGIAFAFERIARTPNTIEAHRLIRLGQRLECQDAVVETLFAGYFAEGADIGDRTVLVGLAERAGIAPGEAEHYLAGDRDRELVLGEDDAARRMGIHGVPCFILEEQYAISGAQEPDVLAEALDRVAALAESHVPGAPVEARRA